MAQSPATAGTTPPCFRAVSRAPNHPDRTPPDEPQRADPTDGRPCPGVRLLGNSTAAFSATRHPAVPTGRRPFWRDPFWRNKAVTALPKNKAATPSDLPSGLPHRATRPHDCRSWSKTYETTTSCGLTKSNHDMSYHRPIANARTNFSRSGEHGLGSSPKTLPPWEQELTEYEGQCAGPSFLGAT